MDFALGPEQEAIRATAARFAREKLLPNYLACAGGGRLDRALLREMGYRHFLGGPLVLDKKIPIEGVAHQCGTVRFGTDPRTSALDPECRAHDVENLYVVDASFFPSSSAVNPGLTIMANALRVGDLLIDRLRAPLAAALAGGMEA